MTLFTRHPDSERRIAPHEITPESGSVATHRRLFPWVVARRAITPTPIPSRTGIHCIHSPVSTVMSKAAIATQTMMFTAELEGPLELIVFSPG